MMKMLLLTGAGLALLLGPVSAQAQSADAGPVVQNSDAMAAADGADMTQMSVRQQIQSQMTKAGYTGVTVTPSSFYVQAKDKQGNPVAMVIGPDSVTEVTEMAPKASGGTKPAPMNGAPSTATKP